MQEEKTTVTEADLLEAAWLQKQLDDLHLVRQSVLGSLKGSPFNPKYLAMKKRIEADIQTIQPLVVAAGMKVARHIEEKYGVKFSFLIAEGSESAEILTPPGGVNNPVTEPGIVKKV